MSKSKYSRLNPKPIPKNINQYLSYNPEYGLFTWIKKPSRRVRLYSQAGCINNEGCLVIGLKKELYLAHRIAWFLHFGEQSKMLDHINGIRADNRISNLRSCTPSQNLMNSKIRSDNTSGNVGVHLDSQYTKWRAKIMVNRKTIYLGYFEKREDAIKARREAEIKFFKDFRHEI